MDGFQAKSMGVTVREIREKMDLTQDPEQEEEEVDRPGSAVGVEGDHPPGSGEVDRPPGSMVPADRAKDHRRGSGDRSMMGLEDLEVEIIQYSKCNFLFIHGVYQLVFIRSRRPRQ